MISVVSNVQYLFVYPIQLASTFYIIVYIEYLES